MISPPRYKSFESVSYVGLIAPTRCLVVSNLAACSRVRLHFRGTSETKGKENDEREKAKQVALRLGCETRIEMSSRISSFSEILVA